jgi:hypothetical protein
MKKVVSLLVNCNDVMFFAPGVYIAMHLFIDAGLLSLPNQKPVQASKPVHRLGRHLRSSALIGAAGCH